MILVVALADTLSSEFGAETGFVIGGVGGPPGFHRIEHVLLDEGLFRGEGWVVQNSQDLVDAALFVQLRVIPALDDLLGGPVCSHGGDEPSGLVQHVAEMVLGQVGMAGVGSGGAQLIDFGRVGLGGLFVDPVPGSFECVAEFPNRGLNHDGKVFEDELVGVLAQLTMGVVLRRVLGVFLAFLQVLGDFVVKVDDWFDCGPEDVGI